MTQFLFTPVPTATGHISVKVVADDGSISRLSLDPGIFADAVTWVATDVSQQPAEVQAKCAEVWTAQTVAAYRAAHPYIPPAPPTTDQILTGKVFANARRKAIITAIQTSDDVQLAALIATRYPALSGDALKAVQDIVLVIAGYIRS